MTLGFPINSTDPDKPTALASNFNLEGHCSGYVDSDRPRLLTVVLDNLPDDARWVRLYDVGNGDVILQDRLVENGIVLFDDPLGEDINPDANLSAIAFSLSGYPSPVNARPITLSIYTEEEVGE